MLVEPHNHCVNAADQAIQTFKAHFISALATTDTDFPLQLWDCLTPQVVATLNMLRPSRIDPSMSAYEAVHGPYDWNRYPLAPPGCKAVLYTKLRKSAARGRATVPTHGAWGRRRPLPVQPFFRPRNSRISDFWLSRIVPPALPSPNFTLE
jgi:hypothetical protein